MHHVRKEHLTAVGAGTPFFERVDPFPRSFAPHALALHPWCLTALRVVPTVVGTSAVTAV